MSNFSSYQDALKVIVKILAPHASPDGLRAMAGKLTASGSGNIIENLGFRYQDIGLLFHPDNITAATALANDIRAARESGKLQSILPVEQEHIFPTDLLTWPRCPHVSTNNPLSYWLPADTKPAPAAGKIEAVPVKNPSGDDWKEKARFIADECFDKRYGQWLPRLTGQLFQARYGENAGA